MSRPANLIPVRDASKNMWGARHRTNNGRNFALAAGLEDVRKAAQMIRDHGVHQLVVTHSGETVGMVSSFDLLQLIE